jgi:hypothetical protein
MDSHRSVSQSAFACNPISPRLLGFAAIDCRILLKMRDLTTVPEAADGWQ